MRKSITKFFTLFLSLTCCTSLLSQDYLISSTYLGSRTKAELFLLFFQQVDYDVNLYKITYMTQGIDHLPDTASGLIVTPVTPDGTLLPLVVFEHGTTSGPTDVPSQLRGGYEATMAYAGKGFITFAPDFLGLGDSRGFHPYLHADSEAWASLDMINAGLEWLEFNDLNEPEWDPRYLFIAGYSQGGHASMALHHQLEQFWSFVYPVTAATHMSGPYSISGVMVDLIMGNNNYGNPGYIAYIALGYQTAYGGLFNVVNDIFKEPYAADIDSFYNRQITLSTLNARLFSELNAGGNTYPWRMLQDSLITNITTNPNHPFNIAFEDNDTYHWAPQAPTRLYYCSGDDQVPYENSIVAEAEMQALGALDLEAIDWGSALNHGFCAIPSLTNSIAYFLSFLTPSSLDNLDRGAAQLQVHPNPATDIITVDWLPASAGMEYTLINLQGQTIHRGYTSSSQINVGHLTSGIYGLLCTAGGETRISRFIRL